MITPKHLVTNQHCVKDQFWNIDPDPNTYADYDHGACNSLSVRSGYLEANQELTESIFESICAGNLPEIELFYPDRHDVGSSISTTLRKDTIDKTEDALLEIYRRLMPGDAVPSP